jgi:hypothetical protein
LMLHGLHYLQCEDTGWSYLLDMIQH